MTALSGHAAALPVSQVRGRIGVSRHHDDCVVAGLPETVADQSRCGLSCY
ncbi:hypothetical protein [Parasynechococcus marenigrum]|nr:hypothetical protein [Parasynechococcus marenigrum]